MSKEEIPTISIDTDKACSKCGKDGAVKENPDGLCMTCIGNNISERIKADNEPKFFESIKEQQFAIAHEAALIGKRLVSDFHLHLSETRIEYVFLWKTPEKLQREIWGRAKKVSGLSAWFATEDREAEPLPDSFFVIELAWQVWRRLNDRQKTALVDHELSHCNINDKLKPCLKGHDCEEFNQIIRRHGLWMDDVRQLLEAAKEAEENPLLAEQIYETI
jgi:hypothetical protein